MLVAAALVPSDYGAYALAAGIAGVLSATLDFGMSSALSRYIAQGRGAPRLVASVVLLRTGLLLIGAVIVAAIGRSIDGDEYPVAALLPAAGVLIVVQGAVAMLYGTLPAMRRVRLLLTITVVQPFVELGAVVWIVIVADGDAVDVLLAAAIAAAVSSVIGYASLVARRDGMRLRLPGDVERETATLADVLHYGRQLFLVSLLVLVFGQVDQFVIAFFHSAADVAPYALALKLQAFVIAPAITATAIIAPRIAGAGSAALVMYRQWLAFFVVLYLGAGVVLAVLARDLFTTINPEYADDWGVLVALVPFMVLTSLATLPSVTLNQVGHAGSRLHIAAITLALNIGIDLALVPPFGAYGAAVATTAAFGYYVLAHHRLVDRVLRAETVDAPPPLAPVLIRGASAAVGAGVLALALRPFAQELGAGRSGSAIVVAIAAGVPAVLHIVLTTRIVRRGGTVSSSE